MNQRLESVPFPSITLLSMVPIPGLLLVHTPRGLSLIHPGNVRLVDFLYTYMYIHCAYIYMCVNVHVHAQHTCTNRLLQPYIHIHHSSLNIFPSFSSRITYLACCVWWLPRGRPSFTCTSMKISLTVAPSLMERSYQSIPSGILTAHTE